MAYSEEDTPHTHTTLDLPFYRVPDPRGTGIRGNFKSQEDWTFVREADI